MYKYGPCSSVTSQGPGVQKNGPNIPKAYEEYHSIQRLRISSETGVNCQRKCERFYIGDEHAVPTRYRVHGKSKSGRLFERME